MKAPIIRPSRLKSAWLALRGASAGSADCRARLVALELDLRERDAELVRVREEYRQARADVERAYAEAANSSLCDLAGRLAPVLSQLATLQHLAESGRETHAPDALKLCGRLEAILAAAGLVRIGQVGIQGAFDERLHQPLSNAQLPSGAPVTIRFVGYCLGEAVLLKAMVSRATATAGEMREARSKEAQG